MYQTFLTAHNKLIVIFKGDFRLLHFEYVRSYLFICLEMCHFTHSSCAFSMFLEKDNLKKKKFLATGVDTARLMALYNIVFFFTLLACRTSA